MSYFLSSLCSLNMHLFPFLQYGCGQVEYRLLYSHLSSRGTFDSPTLNMFGEIALALLFISL